MSGLFFGIRQGIKDDQSNVPPGIDENAKSARDKGESADLVIWHWLDGRDQSQQQFEEAEDRAFSYLCVYRVKENKFVRLADEALRDVIPAPKNRWAVGFDEREYQLTGSLSGHCYRDIYIVDLRTGARRLAVKKCRQRNPFSTNEGYWGTSPDGEYFLYYNDGHFFTYE
jgi:hypothetical protein